MSEGSAATAIPLPRPPPPLSILSMPPLLLAYAAMVLAQTRGLAIVGLLHGPDARLAAASSDPVLPDSADLCAEYEAAHHHAASDVLHCAGMIGFLLLLFVAAPLRSSWGWSLLWAPPVYYLPAWVGHYGFQKDVPAVFSYGTTWRGWYAGERCAMEQLFAGRIVESPVQWAAAVALAVAFVELATGDRRGGGGGGGPPKQKPKRG